MKYKVGDIVKIKDNLEVKKRYGCELFVYGMKEYRNRQAKITRNNGTFYDLDIDDGRYAWTDEMLKKGE